jgi:hypothetical protein
MKRSAATVCSLILFWAGLIACGSPATNRNHGKVNDPGKELYICPMDTDIHSDKPGTCSRCGMDLEKQTINN